MEYGRIAREYRLDPDVLRDWHQGRVFDQTFETVEEAAQALQKHRKGIKEAARRFAEIRTKEVSDLADKFDLTFSALITEHAEGDWPNYRMAAEHLAGQRTQQAERKKALPWYLRWLP